VQRSVLVSTGPTIAAESLDLPNSGESSLAPRPAPRPSTPPSADEPKPSTPLGTAEAAERAAIEELLNRVGGVVSRAAAQMGLSRQAFYRRLERLGLSLERRVR
jgi:DNA-binding NtrC family response regulator